MLLLKILYHRVKGKGKLVHSILDDQNVVSQKDPSNALGVAAHQHEQLTFEAVVWNKEHDHREITNIIVTGMGGSALAALLAKVWLKNDLHIPFEVVRNYELPSYISRNTLVIASSYSGNTEETRAALEQAEKAGAQLAVISSGGALIDTACEFRIAHVAVPAGLQPRMAVFYNLRALAALLENFDVVHGKLDELSDISEWLGTQAIAWNQGTPAVHNYAKQLAEHATGKTAIMYGGPLTAPVAYKWKISWNENAKNTSFWNEYPEFNHNEFMGWTSHPIEKPFAVFDIQSGFEDEHIHKRFHLSDTLLSGKRPKAKTVELQGESLLAQLLWGSLLADYVSIYLAILNGIDPTPVDLIEKLKKEL